MSSPLRHRLPRLAAVVASLAVVAAAVWSAWPQQAQARSSVSKLYAVYKVHFAGADLGKFRAWVNFSGDRYSIESKTNLELGFIIRGLFFKLDGAASSSGTLGAEHIRPSAYSLFFKTKKGGGRLKMDFNGNSVSQVTSQPPMRPNPKSVEVTKRDVTNVLDPLSAVFVPASSQRSGLDAAVCRQQIAIFDGKHRFNLTLSHKKTVQVKKRGKRGYKGPALVCRVMYSPVSGHRPDNDGLEFMRRNRKIEAWFIPVPGTRVYVPYHISMPTPYGLATATSTVFDVSVSGRNNVALVR